MSTSQILLNLRETIKRKIQDTIGLEEPVNVRIHVMKIAVDDLKAKISERRLLSAAYRFKAIGLKGKECEKIAILTGGADCPGYRLSARWFARA